MLGSWERFCEIVGNVLIRYHLLEDKPATFDAVRDVMVVDFDVFGTASNGR